MSTRLIFQWRNGERYDAHRKRNNAEYERVFDVSEELVVTVIAVAKLVLEKMGPINR